MERTLKGNAMVLLMKMQDQRPRERAMQSPDWSPGCWLCRWDIDDDQGQPIIQQPGTLQCHVCHKDRDVCEGLQEGGAEPMVVHPIPADVSGPVHRQVGHKHAAPGTGVLGKLKEKRWLES